MALFNASFAADGNNDLTFFELGEKGGGSPSPGDYIRYDSNYNYDIELYVPHLKTPYNFASDLSSLHSTSGVESGQRCHYVYNEDEVDVGQSIWDKYSGDVNVSRGSNCEDSGTVKGSYCKCAGALKCMNSAEIRLTGNSEPLNVDYSTMAPQLCPFFVDCPSGLASPRQQCQSDGGSNCSNKSDKCLQYKNCGLGAEFLEIESGNIMIECEENWNCASGYCTEVTPNLQLEIHERSNGTISVTDIPPKICMPVSNCRPTCSESGEAVPENGFCCSGLSQVLNNNDGQYYCYNSIEVFEEIPGEIRMSVPNQNDCQVIMNEYDEDGNLVYEGSCNLRGKRTQTECASAGGKWEAGNSYMPIKENVYHFERFFAGIEWLWADANSAGKDDYFRNNIKAVNIGQILRQYKEAADTAMFNQLLDIESRRAIEEAKIAEGGHTVSGSFTLRLLSTLSQAQADSAFLKQNAMMDILGFSVDEINELVQNNPLEIPNFLENQIIDDSEWNSLARYRSLALKPEENNNNTIGKYVGLCKKKDIANCEEDNSNNCGNYQQSNKKCVKEAWDVKGIITELIDPDDPDSSVTIIIDPVCPNSIHDFATASNNFINFSEDKFITFLEDIVLMDSVIAGSKGDPSQNKKMPESVLQAYDDNPDLLNKAIFGAFSDYAESVRDSNNCVTQQLLKSNIIIDTEELALIFKEVNPNLTDNQLVSLLEQITPEVKREFAQQAVADLMQYHLAKFHLPYGGTGWTTYCTSYSIFGWCNNEYSTPTSWANEYYYEDTYKALHLNRIILMAGYLARYYNAAYDGLTAKAQCLSDYADKIDAEFNEFGTVGNVNVNEDLANESFDEVEGMSQTVSCPDSSNGGDGGGQDLNTNDAALDATDTGELASVNDAGETNLGSKVGANRLNLGGGKAGMGTGSSNEDNVGASQKSDIEKMNKDSKSKLNAIYKAKSKLKRDLLEKIGLDDPNKGANAASRIVSEMKKNFPLKKALEKTLARNGIDMGVATAAIDSGAIKAKGDAAQKVKKISDVVEKETKEEKKFTRYGSPGLSVRSPASNKELLRAVKKDANKIRKEESENIWEQITKSYLLIGVPRLFDDKK